MAKLFILHVRKGTAQSQAQIQAASQAAPAKSWVLDSCQRVLWVFSADEFEFQPAITGIELLSGLCAYHLLLRVATGLESQVIGETDIFGQVKDAWQKYSATDSEEAAILAPWFQRLFEDTKEIRAKHLLNLGSSSYGSLVRRLLREAPGPTLLVGAGALARSVAPWLDDRELWIINRSAESRGLLVEELSAKGRLVREILPSEEASAWKIAGSAVVCIPMDSSTDVARLQPWTEGDPTRFLIHLGAYSNEAGAWGKLPGFHGLDRLFDLRRSQEDERTVQYARAARACEEKARLRFLVGSDGRLSLPHGWEDLMVFA